MTIQNRHQLTLSTADLGGFELRRDFLASRSDMSDAYISNYDRTTLWYDAFWHNGHVFLICPKLLNFEPLVLTSAFSLDEQPVAITALEKNTRYDIIKLKSKECPDVITIEGKEFKLSTPVTKAEINRFKGMNAHFTISLDNRLEWIRNFAVYHCRTQNLQAMILFDNGSCCYQLQDIEDVLKSTGLMDFIIVSVPLPYGHKTRSNNHKGKFLHHALANLARLRFLGNSRAVLKADIDELIWTEGQAIFDKAVESHLGFVSIAGKRVYPDKELEKPARHIDHTNVNLESVPFEEPKYCIDPQGSLRGRSWETHIINGLKKKTSRQPDIGFLHCHRINTDWKQYREEVLPTKPAWLELDLRYDSKIRELLDRGFSD